METVTRLFTKAESVYWAVEFTDEELWELEAQGRELYASAYRLIMSKHFDFVTGK